MTPGYVAVRCPPGAAQFRMRFRGAPDAPHPKPPIFACVSSLPKASFLGRALEIGHIANSTL
jgi:hypothetical protein